MNKKLSDDYIEKAYVNGAPVHNDVIHLEEYNDEWPRLFQREKKRLQNLLGKEAVQIEHIGSTSVPGLCAKPIIDILLVVEDTEKEDCYVPALLGAGYVLKIYEPEFEHHHMFKGPDTDINLHVYPVGSQEIIKYIRFRDYMRRNKDAMKLYADTKRELAKRKWKYVQNYADAKSEVVTKIINDANAYWDAQK